jgi:UDP-glucose 4-epimerase
LEVLIIGGCGYTGRVLLDSLSHSHNVDSIDLEWFGRVERNIVLDAAEIAEGYYPINNYDVVILTAGHSSVSMCLNDRRGAFNNNVMNFEGILSQIQDHQKFIYASSSSVYSGISFANEEDYNSHPLTMLDCTKRMIDDLASISGKNFYGLRFGSVNGYSPNLRSDLVVNAMQRSAINEGKVYLSNPQAVRPVLGTYDLCTAVYNIIESDSHPGIYNLCSLNATMEEIAEGVAYKYNAEIVQVSSDPTFSMSMSSDKFETTYKVRFDDTLEEILNSLEYSCESEGKRIECPIKKY